MVRGLLSETVTTWDGVDTARHPTQHFGGLGVSGQGFHDDGSASVFSIITNAILP